MTTKRTLKLLRDQLRVAQEPTAEDYATARKRVEARLLLHVTAEMRAMNETTHLGFPPHMAEIEDDARTWLEGDTPAQRQRDAAFLQPTGQEKELSLLERLYDGVAERIEEGADPRDVVRRGSQLEALAAHAVVLDRSAI